ncbi:MAG: alpha/beta hydrolase family protein, partial [Planctomycetia bacterium]
AGDRLVGPIAGDSLEVGYPAFYKLLGAKEVTPAAAGPTWTDARTGSFVDDRQQRQVAELTEHTQRLLRRSPVVRQDFLKKAPTNDLNAFQKANVEYKKYLWEEVFGRLPDPSIPPEPKTRKLFDRPKWTGYEVVLDVWPGVYAWGYLLVPKDVKPGEKRPVVVCQHGLEGVPNDVVTEDPNERNFAYYHGFAAKLADCGFVTFAPHNPYRGQDRFRLLQRRLNPLKKTLFSVILGQHQRILEWLATQPFVDKERIGFYGLSYGGKTAVRAPPLLDGYALSICSADYNEWNTKNAGVDHPFSYMFTGEYEIFEFDLGNTFEYGDLAALMAPRPFMVERGHTDGVAPDEWVASQFARVKRTYDFLGIGDRAEMEVFNGPHEIHGVGTFDFLHKHLKHPKPPAP